MGSQNEISNNCAFRHWFHFGSKEFVYQNQKNQKIKIKLWYHILGALTYGLEILHLPHKNKIQKQQTIEPICVGYKYMVPECLFVRCFFVCVCGWVGLVFLFFCASRMLCRMIFGSFYTLSVYIYIYIIFFLAWIRYIIQNKKRELL